MSFNSWQFLLFLPIVILVYYLLPHKVRWIWLLGASYLFYMSWNAWLILLIITTTLISYGAGLLIEKTESHKGKKAWMIVAVCLCLGLLIFFKYFNFLISSVIEVLKLFTVPVESWSLNILLPVGISFYTFQTLSYVIDIYRGKYKAERHLGYYALFVSFFPQLVAGPIERPDKLIPQLKEKHRFDLDDFLVGFRIMVCGFFYKICIADFSAIFVNSVYGNLADATSLSVFLASLLFCLQIYGDFNGYSEIAVGSARMMGIKLTRNFNRPYTSLNFTEYFRRWHISLNSWFTHYLYIPLGGNRKGKVIKWRNILIVFALCGLWHGADWTFVIWGLCAAVTLIVEDAFGPLIQAAFEKKGIDPKKGVIRVLRHTGFILLLIPPTIFFRSQNINDAMLAYQKLFTAFPSDFWNASIASLALSWPVFALIVVFIVYGECLISFSEYNRDAMSNPGFSTMPAKKLSAHVAIIGVTLAAIMIMWIYGLEAGAASSFAYFQF